MHLKSVKHAACYISGGVDSAVAALLMKGKGTYITGLFLRNRYEDNDVVRRRFDQARKVSEVLKIPLKEVTLNDNQWGTFSSSILTEYRHGANPSLDVLYNRHILFGGLFEYAVNDIGVDFVVSGHYARTTAGQNIDKWTRYLGNKLFKAVDQLEDQSYQLCLVPQTCLQKVYFPLGDFNRDVVSRIVDASELKKVFDKSAIRRHDMLKEKQVFRYLKKELPDTVGKFCDLESGDELEDHKGLHLWHIGMPVQVDGKTYFVAEKDQKARKIKVVEDLNHPSLYSDTLVMSLPVWSHEVPYNFFEKQMMGAELRLHCYQTPSKCCLTLGSRDVYYSYDHVIVSSLQPFKNAIPGHVTAFYNGEECIGGAKILRAGPSKYILNYKQYRKSTDNIPPS